MKMGIRDLWGQSNRLEIGFDGQFNLIRLTQKNSQVSPKYRIVGSSFDRFPYGGDSALGVPKAGKC